MSRYVPSTTKAKRGRLSTAALHSMLAYDKKTGIFVWKVRPECGRAWNTRYAGKVAGYKAAPDEAHYYWNIRIHDYPFCAHILAWKYITGRWPKVLIDHKDNDGLNNRWSNLREANKQQNSVNSGCSKNNKLGLKGVSFSHGRFRATIGINGKQIWLGYHDTPQAAHEAYVAAAKKYHGEFARAA